MAERLDLLLPVSPKIAMLLIDDEVVQEYDRQGRPRWTLKNGGLHRRYKYKVDPHRMRYVEYLPELKERK